MNLEAELTRREPAGAKLHTGRSRNDQVALDTRMWLRDELSIWRRNYVRCNKRLLLLHRRTTMSSSPATHTCNGHSRFTLPPLAGYVEMVERDRERLLDAFSRVNVCPLGSGALAGPRCRSTANRSP
ncbi:MAG: hypothetical protein CM1200mP29_16490 [Verrucomicrobiota bacterium]|nr:MAG: hypothetical protein CM1200mP29_16490 [Verrucomicrobiota bacterium]